MTAGMTAPSVDPVRWTVDDDLLLVTIDNPPVNALSHAVRTGLMQALDHFETTDTLRAMVLESAGNVFIGGADIREFTGPRRDPLLSSVCQRIESCDKPIAVAMQGAALGGGLEIALASHYRVAAAQVEVAFPEVLLGLLPGAGGTQRAPRLCGAALALDLMLTGRRLTATDAQRAGLLDAVSTHPLDTARQWVRAASHHRGALRRSCEGQSLADAPPHLAVVEATRARLDETHPELFAPRQIVTCVQAAIERPFNEGLAVEAEAFRQCLVGPQRAALVHLFFAERELRRSVESGVDMDALGRQLSAALLTDETEDDTAIAREVPSTTWSAPRCHAMAAVGRALLASGMARTPGDIDVASVRFAGFPRHRGGVLYDAAQRGAQP